MTTLSFDIAPELEIPLFDSENPVRTVRVGLAGCGVVGGALVRLLHDSSPAIAARHGVRFELSRILVRDADRCRGLPLGSSIFTSDADVFNAEDVDVVVEAIGGDDTARVVAHSALNRGKRFVTANKQLVASAGPELAALAQRTASALDFGAAVGGSAPVISLLRDLLGTATPASVRGILNGTTNFILTLVESGISFAEALEAARRAGLAEADCSRDLDGRDAAAKLAIIGWLAYGITPRDLNIHGLALTSRTQSLVHHAAELGGKVRVICECAARDDRHVTATVEPVLLPATSAFARTDLEDNRVEVDLGWSAPLAVSGPGAGGAPTATALLSDLLHASLPPVRGRQRQTSFVPVEDSREHNWLVVASCEARVLASGLGRAGEVLARRESSSRDGGILFRASRTELGEALGALTVAGFEPSVARIELPEIAQRAQ